MTLPYSFALINSLIFNQPSDSLCNSVFFQFKPIFSGRGAIIARSSKKIVLPVKSYRYISKGAAIHADSMLLMNIRSRNFGKNAIYYRNYDRQYLGFIDYSGNEYVFINLIERKKAKGFLGKKRYNQQLGCDIINVFVEPGEEFLEWYYVNIRTNTVEIH